MIRIPAVEAGNGKVASTARSWKGFWRSVNPWEGCWGIVRPWKGSWKWSASEGPFMDYYVLGCFIVTF